MKINENGFDVRDLITVAYRAWGACRGEKLFFHFPMKKNAASRASGMTTKPTLKNCQAVISTFSRRRAISHKMVASDPVTEGWGRDRRRSGRHWRGRVLLGRLNSSAADKTNRQVIMPLKGGQRKRHDEIIIVCPS